MNFYGGGYTDIKHISKSWVKAADKIYKNESIWGIGYR